MFDQNNHIVFRGDVGASVHSSHEMVEKRAEHRRKLEQEKQRKMASKQQEIERLQKEIEDLSK